MLRDPATEPAVMSAYEHQRDEAIRETFRLTLALAAFPPPERFAELQSQLSRALDVEAGHLASRPIRAAVPVC